MMMNGMLTVFDLIWLCPGGVQVNTATKKKLMEEVLHGSWRHKALSFILNP